MDRALIVTMHAAMPPLFHRIRSGSLSAGLVAAATLGCASASTAPEVPLSPSAAAQLPGLALQVRAAQTDAARRTGIEVASLQLADAEPVTWLDGSLGCPEPELMYTQALVPGYRIRIIAGGKVMDYHADARGNMVLCPPDRAVAPAVRRGEPAAR